MTNSLPPPLRNNQTLRTSRTRRTALAAALILLLLPAHASAQTTTLTDPAGAVDDWFGYSVAISGDYAVVGAPRNDTLGAAVGKALVYHDAGAGWVLQASLYPPSSTYADEANFGWSVAIDGDFIVVGAPGLSNGLGGNPRAHVFARSGTTWPHQRTFVAAGGDPTTRLGEAVGIDGNLMILGAPSEVDGFVEAGAAYLWERTLSSWSQIHRFNSPAPGTKQRFGRSVDILGNRVAVGRLRVSDLDGAVFTFTDIGAGWAFEQPFSSPHGLPGASFGASVALTAEDLIIGAPTHEHYPSTGAVFIYHDYGGTSGIQWNDELLETDAGGTGDRHGAAVDGEGPLFVGAAPFADGSSSLSGATHVYYRQPAGAIVDLVTEHAPVPTAYEYFGSSVSISGACHIVGAPDNVLIASSPGSAYVFCNPGAPSLLVNFDILCCVQIPDFTTGPVEGQVSFENPSAAAAENVTYRVDLLRPGGVVEPVVAETETAVGPGATLVVDASAEIFAGDTFGDYALVAYWADANGEHSEPIGFTVGPVAGVPALEAGALITLTALMTIAVLWRARSHRA